ncbi:MAG: hypothetical protein MI924_23315 [Chloroflexales bacterium]|nr:hypothetical protein [Chloroflexales bacterium]
MSVALAATYHDPQGHLYAQIQRALPTLDALFNGLAIRASCLANEQALALFTAAGALIERESTERLQDGPKLGAARREAIALALQWDAPFVLYCDCFLHSE